MRQSTATGVRRSNRSSTRPTKSTGHAAGRWSRKGRHPWPSCGRRARAFCRLTWRRIVQSITKASTRVTVCSLRLRARARCDGFPLANFHEHQIEHMRACLDQGAVVFAIVEFARDDERLYVPGKVILNAWDRWKAGGKASIPREDLEVQCYSIRSSRGVAVDYLAVVNELIHQTA